MIYIYIHVFHMLYIYIYIIYLHIWHNTYHPSVSPSFEVCTKKHVIQGSTWLHWRELLWILR